METLVWTNYATGDVPGRDFSFMELKPGATLAKVLDARLAGVKKHVLAFPRCDDAFAEELCRRLGREKCYFVEWPKTTASFPEVVTRYGPEMVVQVVADARPYPLEGAYTSLDLFDRLAQLYRDGYERGRSTGWNTLDEYYTVRPGELTIVTGIPGHGKSSWLDALTVNLAVREDWSFAFFSPENQPLHEHMARVLEKFQGKPFDKGPTPRMTEKEMGRAAAWAGEHYTWLLPGDEESWRVEWILARAKELVYRHGIRGLVIDPWNELTSDREKGESETDQVSRVLRLLRQFARRNGVHVWLVVHPTKLKRDENTGQYPVPTLYDCSGSAHFRNKADNGISIWRDVKAGTADVQVHIQKIRFKQIGRVGQVTLWYDPPTGTYSPIGRL